jgi:hypothetical protein
MNGRCADDHAEGSSACESEHRRRWPTPGLLAISAQTAARMKQQGLRDENDRCSDMIERALLGRSGCNERPVPHR